jgi:hypothetical protein
MPSGEDGFFILIEGYHRMTALYHVWQVSQGVQYNALAVPPGMLKLSNTGYNTLKRSWIDSKRKQFVLPDIPALVIKADCSREDLYSWCYCMFLFLLCFGNISFFSYCILPHLHTHTHTHHRHQWPQRGSGYNLFQGYLDRGL